MFATLSFVLFAVSSTFAASTPLKRQFTAGPQATHCNSGTLQCCQHVQDPSSSNYHQNINVLHELGFLHGLDVIHQGSSVPVGVGCAPINVPFAGGAGGACNTEPLCCTHTSSSGLLGAGCSPAGLNF